MFHKMHKKSLDCGTQNRKKTTDINEKVTCKKCLRLLENNKPSVLWEVTTNVENYNGDKTMIILASSASKSKYECFKRFFYNPEACEDIGMQFNWFKKYKPTVKLSKSKEKTLTAEEKCALQEIEIDKKVSELNKLYPAGTEVLFQADGAKEATKTKLREIQRYGNYMVAWVEATGSSYHLDDRWIRFITEENKDLKKLR